MNSSARIVRVASRARRSRRSRRLFKGNGSLIIKGRFRGVFLFMMNAFEKMASFRLVFEKQASIALFYFKGVEEGSVLVVLKINVEFLVPDNTFVALQMVQNVLVRKMVGGEREGDTYANIYHFQKKGVSYKIIHQCNGARKSRIRPYLRVWICDVQSSYSGIHNLI